MTEFEQRVAQALFPGVVFTGAKDAEAAVMTIVGEVVPRVAAAIEAGISEAARAFGGPYGPEEDAGEAPERAALAALRGES